MTTSDGTTVTVTTSDDTEVSVSEEIEVSDIAEGDTVMVMGETSDDVVTATTIRVGELGGGFRGGPDGDAGSGAAPGAPGTSSSSSSGSGTTGT